MVTFPSYADVLAPDHDPRTGCNQPKAIGDRVYCGTNHGPVHTIMGLAADGTAWVRSYLGDAFAKLDHLRRA